MRSGQSTLWTLFISAYAQFFLNIYIINFHTIPQARRRKLEISTVIFTNGGPKDPTNYLEGELRTIVFLQY